MKTQRPRILIVEDGRNLAFCHLKFRKALSIYVNRKRSEGQILTLTELVQNIAEHLHLSEDSINNYKKGHNGPASIEVVKKIADYLEVEWIDLMKEVSPMAEKKMMTMEKTIESTTDNTIENEKAEQGVTENNGTYQLTEFEKKSAWNAVREVYKALRIFVSFFEEDYSVELDLEDTSADPIIRTYNYCWTILHKHMLDIPDHTYEQLEELITEMRYWIYGLPVIDMDNFDPEVEYYRLDYFGRLQYLELNDEMGVEPGEMNELVTKWVVEDFYSAIRSILKNYIPREPGAGGGCPQTRPAKE